jgi:hypothetical protein
MNAVAGSGMARVSTRGMLQTTFPGFMCRYRELITIMV